LLYVRFAGSPAATWSCGKKHQRLRRCASAGVVVAAAALTDTDAAGFSDGERWFQRDHGRRFRVIGDRSAP
jgi:hypothetical protein